MTTLEIRSTREPGSLAMRAAKTDGGRTLFGHFARFNSWYEVNSRREGHFLERIAPGAFRRAFSEQRAQIRVMFEHGQDPTVGQKPLGDIVTLEEDREGPYYEVELFDASYVNDLVPAFNSPQTGASWRFSVPEDGDEWNRNARTSSHNPLGLPERTITNPDVFEFGPVVWGANPSASSGVRSGTDDFIEHLLNDPLFVARFTERAGLKVVERVIASATADGQDEDSNTPDSDDAADGLMAERRTRIAERLARFRHAS